MWEKKEYPQEMRQGSTFLVTWAPFLAAIWPFFYIFLSEYY
jgi:hypothetical protein